ncbi:cell wall-binding repeat-containing protein [Desulfosporosinus youngiae]|uniref:Cell wall-binding protein n=1 Tax=Desulfosporosinus youngiae DSM 17734 TaxID=768710 RepID=H5XZZ4_9FIRM|nr:cell wall-binding repeat-containing protein [Desulfosporosinus youngiae]EHQ91903.1 cell wall-binding protein [Desulfosporosinus youngiae DSM 17734]
MRKTKKALATLAIAGMTLSMLPFNAFAAVTVPERLAGVTAEQTAVKIAERTGWTGSAILASSASYGMVDALTAGPLASVLEAPILLQGAGDELNKDTKAELERLEVETVYVTSGTAVISQAVLDQLEDMDITVVSLGGNDRFDTSVNIAKQMIELEAPVSKVAVAYGWKNQDALSIASIAAAQTQPILLTEAASIPESVQEFLSENEDIVSTDIIGGTAVISDDIADEFPDATRHFGMTAYDTNVEVLKAFEDIIEYDHVFVANGETAIDALAGAPLAAQYNAGIILTDGSANEGTAYVSGKLSADSVVTALGGTAVVPDSALKDLIEAQAAAAAKLAAIEKIDGIELDGDASEITAQDLIAAGVAEADVIEANLEAYQTAISAAADEGLNSAEKIQAMVTAVNAAKAAEAAIAKIDGIELDGDASEITAQDLIDAGVAADDVIEANLEAYQTAISAAEDEALDSTEKIQAMVTAVNTAAAEEQAAAAKAAAIAKIDGIAKDGDAAGVTLQDLIDAGVAEADVLAANLEAYQTAISAAEDEALDSTEEIQAMVASVNEASAEDEDQAE